MVDRSGDPAWDEALARPSQLVRGADAPSLTARLDRWLADARVDDAALRRSRERWLHDVAAQEATVAGVLADLAERHVPISVRAASGRRHHGVIRVIGLDFVGLQVASGAEVILASDAIGSVRTAPRVGPTTGDRVVTAELRLADVLTRLAADREHVLVVTRSGDDAVAGVLSSVGFDVVTVRVRDEHRGCAYVPLLAIAEVVIG